MDVHRQLLAVFAVICVGTAAVAQSDGKTEVPRGLWETPLSPGGIKFHVRTKRCGSALCGRVERVKNRRGYDAPSDAVSSMVLVEMRAQPDGDFFGEVRGKNGQAYPQSRVSLRGNALLVRACDDTGCIEETWKRLR